jgi:hypothetical protein
MFEICEHPYIFPMILVLTIWNPLLGSPEAHEGGARPWGTEMISRCPWVDVNATILEQAMDQIENSQVKANQKNPQV